MTIAESASRLHSPLARFWPYRTGYRFPLEAEGHVEEQQIDRPLSMEASRVNGFPAGAILFGPFCLLPDQRLLLDADKPVHLGSRALDVLIALVERAGELVGKNELMARVWPDTIVEEGNLKVHVAGLRRALRDGRAGNRYLINIPGRGYRFVAPVRLVGDPQSSTPPAAATKCEHNLPTLLTRLIGRAGNINELTELLPQRRLLTIAGPGGIGKTAVAVAVAEEQVDAYEHGVWMIDLSSVSDPLLVPSALAATIGLEIHSEKTLPGLIAALRHKQILLVLDNCEHVIAAAAELAAGILSGATRVHIIATSREPLRAEGEHIYRLPSLTSPPPSTRLTAAEALAFPAIQLFVERAAASLGGFKLSDADAPLVVDICSKLDGIPLAIEFAASRVAGFGVPGLASRLNDCLRLLTSGRRTAPPRHQTMSATLDWSYDLLPELERVVLRRLAVFTGAFLLETASAVAASSEVAASEIADCIANLVAKSLVTADLRGTVVRYWLLETTRAYALEKLVESGESDQLTRRHAKCGRNLSGSGEVELGMGPAGE